MIKKRLVLMFLIFVFGITLASAHQPRIVDKFNLSEEEMIVQNPETSQAFYGELKSLPEHYKVNSNANFNLYVRMLSPDLKDARTDFVIRITHENETWVLNGSEYNWTKFHEEFANDDYNQGPEFDQNVSAGEYLITILNKNSNNTGKYVLVFGKQEKFPLNEMLNAFLVMPGLKIYFEKSPLSAYFNMVGVYSLVFLLCLAVLIIIIVIILKVRRKNPYPL
jgi:hypothetical protein